jgi:hypothetical protein
MGEFSIEIPSLPKCRGPNGDEDHAWHNHRFAVLAERALANETTHAAGDDERGEVDQNHAPQRIYVGAVSLIHVSLPPAQPDSAVRPRLP